MTGNGIPAGLGRDDILRHAAIVGMAGALINQTSAYLVAPDGSPSQTANEDQLEAMVESILGELPREADMALILLLLSLIVAVADEAEVQRWFDNQSEQIRRALG